MKRFAYPLIYIALFGFVTTVAANLMNRRDIAIGSLIASCGSLFFGIIVAAFIKLNSNKPSDVKNRPGMRSMVNLLVLSGFISVISGLLLKMQYYPSGGHLVVIGLLCLLFSMVISLFIPVKANRNTIPSFFYRLHIITKAVVHLGIIFLISGLLFKILHYSGGEFFLLIGFLMMLCTIFLNFLISLPVNKEVLPPQAYRFYIVTKIMVHLGLLFLICGILVKILHFSGGGFLLLFGTVITLFSILFSSFIPGKSK